MAILDKEPCLLIIDDDIDTLNVFSRYLELSNLRVIAVSRALDCLQLFKGQKIDLILLDLMMPEIDGFEFCRRLKLSPESADIPIIMVTVRDDQDALLEARRLGVDEFLVKPVFRHQLLQAVQTRLA